MEEKKDEGTGTLRKDKTLLRDEKKMEKLKQKLHTDDECKQDLKGPWGGEGSHLLCVYPESGIYILRRKGRCEEVTLGSARAMWA